MSKLTESQRIDLLRFELESIEAGGPEMVDTDTYEVTGDADASWELSLSAKCGEALAEIRRLERDRDALAAHIERYRAAYVNLTNCVEFADNGEGCYVAGGDLMHEFDAIWKASPATSLARRDAAMKAEALAVAAEAMAMAGHGPRVIKDLRDLAAGREEPDKPVDKAEAGDAGD